MLTILEEWRHFVEGMEHQVEIWTDHKNLEYFMTAKKWIKGKLVGHYC